MHKVKIHRVREVVPNRGVFIFPVATLRHKGIIEPGDVFSAPADDMPVLDAATSDDEADGLGTGPDDTPVNYPLLYGPADPRIDAAAVRPPSHSLAHPPTGPSPLQGGVVPPGDTMGTRIRVVPRTWLSSEV